MTSGEHGPRGAGAVPVSPRGFAGPGGLRGAGLLAGTRCLGWGWVPAPAGKVPRAGGRELRVRCCLSGLAAPLWARATASILHPRCLRGRWDAAPLFSDWGTTTLVCTHRVTSRGG